MRHTHTDLAKTVIRVILFETCSSTLLDNTVLCAMELLVMSVIVKERQNIVFFLLEGREGKLLSGLTTEIVIFCECFAK